jgi:hypothetical protein
MSLSSFVVIAVALPCYVVVCQYVKIFWVKIELKYVGCLTLSRLITSRDVTFVLLHDQMYIISSVLAVIVIYSLISGVTQIPTTALHTPFNQLSMTVY